MGRRVERMFRARSWAPSTAKCSRRPRCVRLPSEGYPQTDSGPRHLRLGPRMHRRSNDGGRSPNSAHLLNPLSENALRFRVLVHHDASIPPRDMLTSVVWLVMKAKIVLSYSSTTVSPTLPSSVKPEHIIQPPTSTGQYLSRFSPPTRM